MQTKFQFLIGVHAVEREVKVNIFGAGEEKWPFVGNGRPSRTQYEHCYVTDIIKVSVNPYRSGSSKIADLYLNKGLSANQMAQQLDMSKTVVLDRLDALGIRKGTGNGDVTNPSNYRAPVAP